MRFTRAGKSTHQRVPSEPTSWEALKSTPPKPSANGAAKKSGAGANVKNGNTGPKKFKRDEKGGSRGGKPMRKKPQKFRRGREEEVSANFVQLGNREKPTEAEENDENGNTENVGDETSKKGKKKFVLGDNKQVKFLGMFWVSVEESKRLKALHKKLKGQGMSRKAIEVALRQERRNAEKNAKRARDKICFGCRTFGHMFSQCPERKKTEDGTGGGGESAADAEVCFKCGSTEHKSRHCKKTSARFDFATCFICSKSGHIARQCPDNSKGIYPLGGSCNLCDETTHLAKDCPTLVPEEHRGSKKDDDAIVSRINNPFTSPEFEEWNLEMEDDKKEDTEVGKKDVKISESSKPLAKKRKVKF